MKKDRLKFMFKRLTAILLFLALSGSIVSGMPLHAEKSNSHMMPCCKKAKSGEKTPKASLARLCCSVNCTDPSPTSSASTFNFSPSSVNVRDSIIAQIAALVAVSQRAVLPDPFSLERAQLPRKIPPKYIKHKSFLI